MRTQPYHFKKLNMYLRFIRQCHSVRPTGKVVRQSFIDYFVQNNNHTFIRSSPVAPFCDPTVAFVNAGMNQFKGVLLGNTHPPCLRAANSQKCIRVGGKHNDLDVVGTDGYHHTFFEMLGSWSFGDYFKKEACELAWNLLTDQYGLHPSRLYVTYFGGDSAMGLEPDLETRDIWRQIGVSRDRILPFGSDDNFWEMGVSGPCGPCTEIHVDHISGRQAVTDKVNKGHDDLTEIWNLVFIQYNRSLDGSLKELPCQHVDTGMGLERLVAILQGKQSNYDTDLFQPLFGAIHKHSRGVPLYQGFFGNKDENGTDTGYRILADHARMITVALADGMFPDQNYKLRRVMRKAMLVSQQKFGVERGLLRELTNYVAESLGEVYPEIENRLKQIQLIISHEEELLHSLRLGAAAGWQKIIQMKPELGALDIVEMPGLVAGYHELTKYARNISPGSNAKTDEVPGLKTEERSLVRKLTNKDLRRNVELIEDETGYANVMLPSDLAFKLYDTYGLEEDVIRELARIEGLEVDINGFRYLLNVAKASTKESFSSVIGNGQVQDILNELKELGVNSTDDSYKYNYTNNKGTYEFPPVESEVKAIIVKGKLVPEVEPDVECSVILNRTNFYHEAGGQTSDTGVLVLKNGTEFLVTGATNNKGYIFHHGYVDKEGTSLHTGDKATVKVDELHRLGNMRNHTATHLLNAALHKILTVTCQKSSHVAESNLVFDFAVYGETFDTQNIEHLEKMVQGCINARVPVTCHTVMADELFSLENVTLVPGEVYPEQNIRIIEIEATDLLTSREACCGTHVLDTGDIQDFCIVGLKTAGTGTRSLKAVTGHYASSARHSGRLMTSQVAHLLAEVEGFLICENTSDQVELLDTRLHELTSGTQILPYSVRVRELEKIEMMGKKLKESARGNLRNALEIEMKMLLGEKQQPCVVHFLQCSSTMDTVPLQKATRMCPHTPILLLAHSEGVVKGRCCVPKELVSENFNAQMWMQTVLHVLKSQGSAPRGQDPTLVFNMKGKKIPANDLNTMIEAALQKATHFAKHHLRLNNTQEQTSS